MSDFEQVLIDAGIPTTEDEITAEFTTAVTDSGSTISNSSAYSPFWRIIAAIATKPVLWLVQSLINNVMPQFFLSTVSETLIEEWGDNYNCSRKQAQTLNGHLLFTRTDVSSDLTIPAGTKIYTDSVNNNVYQLFTDEEAVMAEGEDAILLSATAEASGTAYNLEAGYYRNCDLEDVSVVNPENWIDVIGADLEEVESYRTRIRNAFNRVSYFHTDGVYRSLISEWAGVQEDRIWFEHSAPRGPGTANAYVLFELDAPSESYLATINRQLSTEGYHGHGDDIVAYAMPEVPYDLIATVYLPDALLDVEKSVIMTGIEDSIYAAFRGNSAFAMTQTLPYSRFSFTRLAAEIYGSFPDLISIEFNLDDISSTLSIPALNTLEIIEGDL